VFNDKQSTQYHKKQNIFNSMNETFWTRWLCEWRRRKNRWQILSALFLVVKRVLNRIWNFLKVFRCKLVYTQMVFDSRLQLCDLWNTAYYNKEKARTLLNYFVKGPW